jgi:3-hydroxyisobutyrate dehydrogenase-like beta-hydroxyacid dehydrogenase
MKIGFIGLGIMGSRMAANLLKHGHALVVFNRTPEKAAALVNDGATLADSPAAVAAQVDVLFTMLAHPQAVEEAALGEDGFLSHLKPGRLWVDCSTVNPSFSREMAVKAEAQHIRFLGAPVTGSKGPAALGKLVFWVGGDLEDLEAVRPFLECMGDRIVHCGGQGMGVSMKMVINQMLGTAMAAFAEGLILGESLGLSRKILFEALLGGPAVAPFLSFKRERIETGNYGQADFPLRWLQKDMHLAAVSAYETGVAMPLANITAEIYSLAIRVGRGEEDFSAIYDFLARNCEASPRDKATADHADAASNETRSAAYAQHG